MKILDLFDMYFLILMAIWSLIAIFKDSKLFYREKKFTAAKKVKGIGISMLGISILLFVVRSLM